MEDEQPSPRYQALLQVYTALPSLDFTTTDVIGLDDDEYVLLLRTLGILEEQRFSEEAEEEEHPLNLLRSASFWNTVSLAMNTVALRRFLMEQLVMKRYIQHRIFLCSGEEDAWFPCDVDSENRTMYAPTNFKESRLVHQEEDAPTLLVLEGVVSPFGPLAFQELYEYLDHGFVLREKEETTVIEEVEHLALSMNQDPTGEWMVETGRHLHLLDDVDPAYFEEIFDVGEKGGFAGRYLSPLLVHDILIHAAPVQLKGTNEDLIEYINAMLPTTSAPYQYWWKQTASFMEAPFFLYSLFKFLALKY